jgi:hypothetical protein
VPHLPPQQFGPHPAFGRHPFLHFRTESPPDDPAVLRHPRPSGNSQQPTVLRQRQQFPAPPLPRRIAGPAAKRSVRLSVSLLLELRKGPVRTSACDARRRLAARLKPAASWRK